MDCQDSQDYEDENFEQGGITMDILPDNCLELIFTHVDQYEGFNNIRSVSRRWNRLADGTQRRMKRLFLKCIDFSWKYVEGDHLLSERCSHAICFHPDEHKIYMFGGCNNTYTAFNDLWSFDLNTHQWERVFITGPPMPSPKALSTMVLYKGNLLLFGGFSKSSMNPIHQTSTFYNELHQFKTNEKKPYWEEIISENTAPHLAGHTASIVGDFMLIFGGSMGSSYNNNVYVLDLCRRIWNMPSIPGPCPPPRYGQSQILMDDRHLIIIGGCGGPSVNFSDVWLLDFDLYGDEEWRWTQLKVDNPELTPPFMWCHRACKVGTNAVVVSRPIKYDSASIRRNGSNRRGLYRRRTSSQSTNSSIGGSSGRLTSPDSPSDRRAVAAAFCAASSAEQLNQHVQGKLQQHRDRKPILLTSRSLDDQEHQRSGGNPAISASTSYADLQNKANLSVANPHSGGAYLNPTSSNAGQKAGELHRACSIPAIIVGEIPKLIVTSSSEAPPLKTAPNVQQQRSRNDFTLANKKLTANSAKESSSSSSSKLNSKTMKNGKNGTNKEDDPVREHYLTLVKEEYNRLRIVELEENLTDMGNLLRNFLSENIPYLSRQEREEIVEEFMANEGEREREQKEEEASSTTKGSILELQNSRSQVLSPDSQMERERDDGPSTSSAATNANNINAPPTTLSAAFGPFYGRHMCVFVLRLDNVLVERRVRWEQLPIEEDAPEDRLLHSLVAGYGELILFGGMFSEGTGMDCLNVGMERYTMSSDTFILKPRYNEM